MEEGETHSFSQVVTRNDKKKIKLDRKRARVDSPPTPSVSNGAACQPPKSPQNTSRRPMMIGQAKNSTLKASKTLLVAKSVYRLGNIDAGYTVDDVTNHVESMGVRVISCFDRTSANAVSEENKSFRICIIDADKKKFSQEIIGRLGLASRNGFSNLKSSLIKMTQLGSLLPTVETSSPLTSLARGHQLGISPLPPLRPVRFSQAHLQTV